MGVEAETAREKVFAPSASAELARAGAWVLAPPGFQVRWRVNIQIKRG